MEHAQRADYSDLYTADGKVLILILMEHAQREFFNKYPEGFHFKVLILILMEHAQRVAARLEKDVANGLNPYFNGTCSKSFCYYALPYCL